MDEEADDLYENAEYANTGITAVALYDYQVTFKSQNVSSLIVDTS